MSKIRLPIDTKSLYFNIKNDNLKGHTPTVASPLKKNEGEDKLENILIAKKAEVDISDKNELIELLIKHSKTKVIICLCIQKAIRQRKTSECQLLFWMLCKRRG